MLLIIVFSKSCAPGPGCRDKDCRWEGRSFPQGCEHHSPRLAGYGGEHCTHLIVPDGMGVGSEAHRREIGNMLN